MLKKFITIRNVGKFRDYACTGDIEFVRLSLIHAENGRGKTTLCAILRSLQGGNSHVINERKTLDTKDLPQVEVLTDSGKLSFKDGAWSGHHPNLAIFDSTYVAENVYAGDYIRHNHKKNLCRVIIGAKGVALVETLDAVDAEIISLNSQLKEQRTAIEKHVPIGVKFDEFLALCEDDQIDKKIAAKRDEVSLLSNADAIRTKPALATLSLPSAPSNYSQILEKDIAGVSADAEQRIQAHIAAHKMGTQGQAWLTQGMQFMPGNTCPFCDQGIGGNKLVAAFQVYFGESYKSLQREVASLDRIFRDSLHDNKILPLQNTLTQNNALADFWKGLVPVELPLLSFEDEIAPTLTALRQVLTPYITRKVQAPLEKITCGSDVVEAEKTWMQLRDRIDVYNIAVGAINSLVAEKKKSATGTTLAAAKLQLASLEAIKKRHTPEVASVCKVYTDSVAKKGMLERQKKACKKDLDAYNVKVLAVHEANINKLLKKFNAGFGITSTELQYVGRSPSSSFKIAINNVAVDVGNEDTPPGTPCFRCMMSSADRSTLALAFFLVELRARPDLADLTVVFDDPFTSMDVYRQHATRDQIQQIAQIANQVIVLSHSHHFLKLVAEDFKAAPIRFLCVEREGQTDSLILPWDMEGAIARPIDKDIIKLRSYYEGDDKDARGAIRCIRTILENFIRVRHADRFPSDQKQWLGDMLDVIRDADAAGPFRPMKSIYDDLSSLNSYTKRYHHDDNTDRTDAGPISDTELQGAAELTLRLIGRLA